MAGEMLRQRIKCPFDEIFIGDVWCARAETLQPRRALRVVGEQPMDISADHPAIGGDRTLGRTIRKQREQ